ncbi:MAG: hypothetical protein M3N10_10595 [Actinomycetota bacterium]|nr:hypothetical protein [Actinomycetota bacterium]HZY66870.1 hypothetical protein [Rubrobacteraceae bacterium]
MTPAVRNRLLGLGLVWGLLLAAVPAFVMTDPYELSGLLIAGVLCAAVSGAVGTLAAGRRAARGGVQNNRTVVAGLGTGFFQGLIGGGIAALSFWAIMGVTLSGFALDNPIELSTLMRPQVFLGSFFVALSVFIYVVAAGVLLGPAFGTLVNRAARSGAKGGP